MVLSGGGAADNSRRRSKWREERLESAWDTVRPLLSPPVDTGRSPAEAAEDRLQATLQAWARRWWGDGGGPGPFACAVLEFLLAEGVHITDEWRAPIEAASQAQETRTAVMDEAAYARAVAQAVLHVQWCCGDAPPMMTHGRADDRVLLSLVPLSRRNAPSRLPQRHLQPPTTATHHHHGRSAFRGTRVAPVHGPPTTMG